MISESVNNYPIDQCWQLLGWVFVGSIPPHTCPSAESNSTNISFDTSHVSSSVTMDWSLVCGNAGLHVSHQLVVLPILLYQGLFLLVVVSGFLVVVVVVGSVVV